MVVLGRGEHTQTKGQLSDNVVSLPALHSVNMEMSNSFNLAKR